MALLRAVALMAGWDLQLCPGGSIHHVWGWQQSQRDSEWPSYRFGNRWKGPRPNWEANEDARPGGGEAGEGDLPV